MLACHHTPCSKLVLSSRSVWQVGVEKMCAMPCGQWLQCTFGLAITMVRMRRCAPAAPGTTHSSLLPFQPP